MTTRDHQEGFYSAFEKVEIATEGDLAQTKDSLTSLIWEIGDGRSAQLSLASVLTKGKIGSTQ